MYFGKATTLLDSEQLIAEVRSRPCLYDMNCLAYKHARVRYEAWNDVAENVAGDHWKDMSIDERLELGRIIQRRWKSLKDAFTRTMRVQRNSGKTKPYIYHKQMSFLLPVMLARRAYVAERESSPELEESVSEVAEVEMKYIPPKSEQSCSTNLTPQAADISSHSYPSAQIFTPKATGKMFSPYRSAQIFIPEPTESSNLTVQQSEISTNDDFVQEPSTAPERNTCDKQDADRMFLLSLLPSLKRIKPEDKLDAQIKLMEVLKSFTSPSTTQGNSLQSKT